MSLIVPSTVRAEVTFRDIANALYDPNPVRFRLKPPGAGAVQLWTYQAEPGIVRVSAGLYRIDVTLNLAGTWTWRWEGDGAVAVTAEGSVSVAASKVLA